MLTLNPNLFFQCISKLLLFRSKRKKTNRPDSKHIRRLWVLVLVASISSQVIAGLPPKATLKWSYLPVNPYFSPDKTTEVANEVVIDTPSQEFGKMLVGHESLYRTTFLVDLLQKTDKAIKDYDAVRPAIKTHERIQQEKVYRAKEFEIAKVKTDIEIKEKRITRKEGEAADMEGEAKKFDSEVVNFEATANMYHVGNKKSSEYKENVKEYNRQLAKARKSAETCRSGIDNCKKIAEESREAIKMLLEIKEKFEKERERLNADADGRLSLKETISVTTTPNSIAESLRSTVINAQRKIDEDASLGGADVIKFIELMNKLSVHICTRDPLVKEAGLLCKITHDLSDLSLVTDEELFDKKIDMAVIPEPKHFRKDDYFRQFVFPLALPGTEQPVSLHAVSAFSSENDHFYLQIAMDSTPKPDILVRKPLNLTIALDVSRSMSAQDGTGQARLVWAKSTIETVIKQMSKQDSLSIVLISEEEVIKYQSTLEFDIDEVLTNLDAVQSSEENKNNLHAGLLKSYKQVASCEDNDGDCENRVILISDHDSTDEEGVSDFIKMINRYAEIGIGLTAISIGDGFSKDVIEAINGSIGGNYLFAESGESIEQWLGIHDLLVSPTAYNFTAEVDVPGYQLLHKYGGSTSRTTEDGNIIDIRQLFLTTGEEVGMILLEYEPVPQPEEGASNLMGDDVETPVFSFMKPASVPPARGDKDKPPPKPARRKKD